jgi:alkylated DNA repair dioxygenase AlkB
MSTKSIELIKDEFRGNNFNVDFYENFLSQEESEYVFNILEKNVKWSSNITPGKRVNQTYGDDGLTYEIHWYGKTTKRKVYPWSDMNILKTIRDKIQEITNEKYNICVVQRYPSGKVGINAHRDKEMKKGTTICGLSLGETRTLSINGKNNINLSLTPGSLYIFNPPTNEYNTHCIDKDDTTNPRISLTFRNYS